MKSVGENEANMCGRKWSQYVLLCTDLVTPRQGKGQWKQYKMVDVNGAYKHGRYQTNLIVQFVYYVKCFSYERWLAGQQDGRMKTTHYVDPYELHLSNTLCCWNVMQPWNNARYVYMLFVLGVQPLG